MSMPFSLRRYEDGIVTEIRGPLTVGRLSDSGIVLRGPKSSRRHAALSVDEGQLFVSDLGAKNGTYINGVRIVGRERIRAGDTLCFDREVFLVQGPPDAAETEVRPVVTWVRTDIRQRGRNGDTVFIKEPAAPDSAGPIARDVQRPTLQILSGALAGTLYELRLDESSVQQWIVGKDEKSDIRLPDEGVSREHAEIRREKSNWKIFNRFATNKVRVDGQEITVRYLNGGDLIGMGPVQAVFLLPAYRILGLSYSRDRVPRLSGARFWVPFAALLAVAFCGAVLLMTGAHIK